MGGTKAVDGSCGHGVVLSRARPGPISSIISEVNVGGLAGWLGLHETWRAAPKLLLTPWCARHVEGPHTASHLPSSWLRRLSLSVRMPSWGVREKGSCRAGPLEMRPVGEFSKSLELVSYLLSPDDRDTYGWNCAPALLVTCCGPDPVYHQVFPCLERGEVSKVGPDRDRYPHKRRGCGQRSVKLRASSIPQGEGRNQDGVPPSQLSRRPVPPPWPQEPSRQTSVL